MYVDAGCKANVDFNVGIQCSEATDNMQRILGSVFLLAVVVMAIHKSRQQRSSLLTDQAANRVGATRLPSEDKPKSDSSTLQAMDDKDLEWGNAEGSDDDWDAFPSTGNVFTQYNLLTNMYHAHYCDVLTLFHLFFFN